MTRTDFSGSSLYWLGTIKQVLVLRLTIKVKIVMKYAFHLSWKKGRLPVAMWDECSWQMGIRWVEKTGTIVFEVPPFENSIDIIGVIDTQCEWIDVPISKE